MGTDPLLVNERLEKALGDSMQQGITEGGAQRMGRASPYGNADPATSQPFDLNFSNLCTLVP